MLFTNQLSPDAEAQNHNLLNGSGLALGDYDNDGWCDVFLCNLNGSSALFRNLGGWQFSNVTAQAGLAGSHWLARAAAFADVNGDGHLDLLITRSGKGTRLFLNDGRGAFKESQQPDLSTPTGSTSLALGDLDGDSGLDLYVANYGENTIRSGMQIATRVIGGKEQVVGRMRARLKIIGGKIVEYGEPDALYLNDRRGVFSRVPWSDGVFRDETGGSWPVAPADLGLTVVIRDINQDGAPDLYVCNDFQDPDRIWINQGGGRFQAIPREAIRMISHFSMSMDFADINRDGYDDFIVTDMLSRDHALRMRQLAPASPPIEHTLEKHADRPQVRRNTLFLNRGDGTYAEIANFAGVAASDWSWTVNFMDVDLDGWEDILIGTGHYYDTQDLDAIERSKTLTAAQRNDPRQVLAVFPPLRTPNAAFRNQGDLTFQEVSRAWGFDALEVSHSLAFADLDNDGDLDVVVNCLNAPALVYRNESSAPRLAVTLRGIPPNTRGIGARIQVTGGAVPMQSQEMTSGGRYLSSDAPMRVFAAGSITNRLTVEVTWPTGKRSLLPSLAPNQRIEVDEGSAHPAEAPETTRPSPLFEAVPPLLPRAREAPFDDFMRQPLLPRKLSQLGPGLAWVDLDNDGRDDLIVGAGRGGAVAVFRNQGDGQFLPWPGWVGRTLPDDSTGMAAWWDAEGRPALLAGLANYESGQPQGALQLNMAGGTIREGTPLAGTSGSTGPLAVADVDGDGTLELFVGGRLIPGRYPEAASSRLFQFRDGRLLLNERDSRTFASIGLVNSALFTDLTGDGNPELVLACDWGALRLFERRDGEWLDTTQQWGLAGLTGLWTSVTAGDFNGDGRMDLVAGNGGLNTSYQQVAPGPWFLRYGEFNGDGQMHLLEAYQAAGSRQLLPWRQMALLEKTLPWLRARYSTHEAFSTASLDSILAESQAPARQLAISHLASTVLLNLGDRFEIKPLPAEAQWAPVFGICVADFNGDGHEDLFLSQNDYAVRPEDSPLDAGRGLILLGDGTGTFHPLPGPESGILIYGQQRGCAVADYDGDGRTDLAVVEHGGAVHLFRNRGAAPGLRVRLKGPKGNPAGIGAVLRLHFADRQGPARELHAGGGYWSQNSTELLLATPRAPAQIEVRWPGGQITRTPIPTAARMIQIDEQGALQ